MAVKPFYLKNDNVLSCTVKDENDAADTGATVTAVTVVEATGASVETGLTLSHDAAGVYEVTLAEASYTAGVHYTAQITVVGSNSEDGYVELSFKAQTRTA